MKKPEPSSEDLLYKETLLIKCDSHTAINLIFATLINRLQNEKCTQKDIQDARDFVILQIEQTLRLIDQNRQGKDL